MNLTAFVSTHQVSCTRRAPFMAFTKESRFAACFLTRHATLHFNHFTVMAAVNPSTGWVVFAPTRKSRPFYLRGRTLHGRGLTASHHRAGDSLRRGRREAALSGSRVAAGPGGRNPGRGRRARLRQRPPPGPIRHVAMRFARQASRGMLW